MKVNYGGRKHHRTSQHNELHIEEVKNPEKKSENLWIDRKWIIMY